MLPQKGIIESLEAEQDKDKILQRIYSYTEFERIEMRHKKSEEDLLAEEKCKYFFSFQFEVLSIGLCERL